MHSMCAGYFQRQKQKTKILEILTKKIRKESIEFMFRVYIDILAPI